MTSKEWKDFKNALKKVEQLVSELTETSNKLGKALKSKIKKELNAIRVM